MFNADSLTPEFLAQAKGFGLSKDEAVRLCGQLGRLPNREELAVCGALWSEHCSYKSSKVHLRRFHTQEPWVLQGPGENAGVVSITADWAIAFKMESHNHPSYIEPYQGAATGVGGILRDVFCMGARPIASLNCLRYGEGAWNANLVKQTVKGIGDYGNSVGVPTVTGDTGFHAGYTKNILVNAFTAGLIHKDRIFKGVLTESDGASPSTPSTKDSNKANAGAAGSAQGGGRGGGRAGNGGDTIDTIVPGATLDADLKRILFPENENVLIYFGSATGRDGVHGATMSSAEFSPTGESLRPTVQVGDPFAEKVLMEATLKLISEGLCVGLQDMGAAGLTSSSVEMAGRSGCGVALELNTIPSRASNLQAFEFLLSESQERMLAAVVPEKVEAVLECLEKFDVQAAVIGRVNHTGKFVCMYDGKVCTALPVDILVEDIPKYEWPLAAREEYAQKKARIDNRARLSPAATSTSERPQVTLSMEGCDPTGLASRIHAGAQVGEVLSEHRQTLIALFSHPAFASRTPITDRYCATVQGHTVAGVGGMQNAAAAVVRLPKQAQETLPDGTRTQVGLAVAGGCEERWVDRDPYAGAALSALKVARRIVAVGGTPLALTDCLNFGSPTNPLVMRQISDVVDGITIFSKELRIPVVSGNVSLNNQTDGEPIPPTPMLGMVGRVEDVSRLPLSALRVEHFKHEPASTVSLVRIALPDAFDRSSYENGQTAWLLDGKNEGPLPRLDLAAEKRLWEGLKQILERERVALSVPVGHGGVLIAALRTAIESRARISFAPEFLKTKAREALAEGNMGFVIGCADADGLARVRALADNSGLACTPIGTLAGPASPATSTSSGTNDAYDTTPLAHAARRGLGQFFGTANPQPHSSEV